MITGNETAMPTQGFSYPDGSIEYGNPGLTKREHFAAMAMQGMCAVALKDKTPSYVLAAWSVDFADALITELNKTQ